MAVNAAFFKTEYKRESAFLLTPVNSGGAKIAEQRRVNCESGWYCRGRFGEHSPGAEAVGNGFN